MPVWGILEPGSSVELCEASISYDGRTVRGCDRYGCSEVKVRPPIVVMPAPPILRPFALTDVVFVEFEEKIFVEPNTTLWVSIPLDLEVVKTGRPVLRLSTTKAKYRLVGSLVEGVIARNHKSPIWYDHPDNLEPCMGLASIHITRGRDVLDGVPINVGQSALYRTSGWERIYYARVIINVTQSLIDSRIENKPPLPGLVTARKPPYTHEKTLSLGQPAVVVERGWRLWPSLKD